MNEKQFCAICERENNCNIVKGSRLCWCMAKKFPKELLEKVGGGCCICQSCLEEYNTLKNNNCN